MKRRTFKCIFCKHTVTSDNDKRKVQSAKNRMGAHYETKHKDLLPPEMDGYRFFYYTMTKKEKGSCVICHQETRFNQLTMKYNRFCDNPLCKQKYKEERDRRMLQRYGKIYLLDDPEMQKKMLSKRKISGTYQWSDGKSKFNYTGSFELDFLKFMDNTLHWPPEDLCAPSPHTYEYEYQGKKHFYIPDFFIPSISCEIEIKDDGSALQINQDSRNKDKIKDEMMRSMQRMFNYIKIVNKDYTKFIELVKEGD